MKYKLLALITSLLASGLVHAQLLEDSKINLEFKNFYFNNDNRDGAPTKDYPNNSGKTEEWAQGFILDMKSGYTEGPVGFGVDGIGLLGVKLNAKHENTAANGLLPVSRSGSTPGAFGSFRVTGKMRFSKTELKVGALREGVPVLMPNMGRMMPTLFRGVALDSREIDGLDFKAGYVDRIQGRSSTNYQHLKSNTSVKHESDGLWYAGGSYQLFPSLTASYYYGSLKDFYRQNYVGFVHQLPVASGLLKTDVRYFNSKTEGAAYGGDVDNDVISGLFSYAIDGHELGAGYQKLYGRTGFPFVDPGESVDGTSTGTSGGTTYLITDVMMNKFVNAKEGTWLVKYNYNFEQLNIPGLSFNVIYLSGNNAHGKNGGSGHKEWERDIGVSYVIQSGMFKNLGFAWKNAASRTSVPGSSDMDENRFIVDYKMAIF